MVSIMPLSTYVQPSPQSILEHFIKETPYSLAISSLLSHPSPKQPQICFWFLQIFLFFFLPSSYLNSSSLTYCAILVCFQDFPILRFHTNGILKYVDFCDQPLSLSIMFLGSSTFYQVTCCLPSYGRNIFCCMDRPYFVYPFVHCGHLGWSSGQLLKVHPSLVILLFLNMRPSFPRVASIQENCEQGL